MAFSSSGSASDSGGSSSGLFPTLIFVQGNEQRTINLDHSPYSVGRKVDKDMVIADPRVSRDHALIVSENGAHPAGWMQFNAISAPADASYDVTFWYHSGQLTPGQADVYGDVHCGGLDYDTGPGTGCRPHLLSVNGVELSAVVGGQSAVYYEFPAYADAWSTLHGAVVAVSLRAGENTIYIKAPGFTTSDAADIDALDVQPSGQGAPKLQAKGSGGPPAVPIGLVTPVVNWN